MSVRLVPLAPGVRAALRTTPDAVIGVVTVRRPQWRMNLVAEYRIQPTKHIIGRAASCLEPTRLGDARSRRSPLRRRADAQAPAKGANDPLTRREAEAVIGAYLDDLDTLEGDDDAPMLDCLGWSETLGSPPGTLGASSRRDRRRRRRGERRDRQRRRRGERREARGERRGRMRRRRSERRRQFAETIRRLSRELAEARLLDKLRRGFNRASKSKLVQALLKAGATAAGGAAGGPGGAMMAQQLTAAMLQEQGANVTPPHIVQLLAGERARPLSMHAKPATMAIGLDTYRAAVRCGH